MEPSISFNYLTRGKRSNPPILFLHGFMGSCLDWQDVVPLLEGEFYCMAIDLPGHGRTQVANDDCFTMPICASLLEQFLIQHGLDNCHLVGYSMGGRLAYYMAAHYPARFGSIIIESASPGLKTDLEREKRRAEDDDLAARLEHAPLADFLDEWYDLPLFASIKSDSEKFRQLLTRRLQNDRHQLARSLRMMGTGVQPSLWDSLSGARNRILLISGEMDRKFGIVNRDVEELCPIASCRVMPGVGHNAHFEDYESFSDEIRKFLLE